MEKIRREADAWVIDETPIEVAEDVLRREVEDMTDLVVDDVVVDDLIAVLASANDVDRQAFVTVETVTDSNVIKTMFRSKENRC